jgi:hypothetical protein
MTGMKEGTGSDPFAEDVVDESEPDEPDDQGPSESEAVLEERSTSESSTTTSTQETSRPSKDDIPYIFRRNRVTDERTLHSFYLREMYEQVEEEARHGVQQRLGEQVPKADLREAMLLVAARDLDAVADELREWGYDMD